MVDIEELLFSYQEKTPIFFNFRWQVARGERWSVIGPSGCGKTTLLYLLAGLLPPKSGKVYIEERPITKPRISTGLILQDFGLLPWATAIGNISLGLRLRGMDDGRARQIAREWLSRLDIDSVSSHYPRELSGGQRQRVAIARTLALRPDLLLMDEPFASLDALTREEMQHLILNLWENISFTMILVTHSTEEAVFLGEKIMILNHPPNAAPIVVDNPGSGRQEYRGMPEFVKKCQEIRELVRMEVNTIPR